MGILRKDEKVRRLYMAYFDDGILDLFVGWIVFFAGLIVFVIFRSSALTQAMREMALLFASGVVAATILGGFLAIGRIHRAPRWYAYAAMTVLFAALAWGLQIGLPWVIMAIGAMISLGGTIYLARFLLNHPVLSKKERPVW